MREDFSIEVARHQLAAAKTPRRDSAQVPVTKQRRVVSPMLAPAQLASEARDLVALLARRGINIQLSEAVRLVSAKNAEWMPNPDTVARLAQAHQQKCKEAGRDISSSEAVKTVLATWKH